MKHICALLAFLVANTAIASDYITQVQVSEPTPKLATVALNAAEASRTTNFIDIRGRTQVTVYIDYTRGATGAATAVTMTCQAGRARDKMAAIPILTNTTTAGTRAGLPHVWSWGVTATAVIRWIVTPLNDVWLRCVIGSTGSVTADDEVSVYVREGVL